MEAAPPLPPPALPPPSLVAVFGTWLAVGVQSFGGGATTLVLIRRSLVETHAWITEDDFARDWTLTQLAPGINLIAFTILLGRRLGGAGGVAVSLAGMLLPSVAITVLLTAAYAHVRTSAGGQAALGGVVPATAGLGLLTAWGMGRSLIAQSRLRGRADTLLAGAVMLASGVVVYRFGPPTVLVLLAGAFVVAGWYALRAALFGKETGV